MLIRAEQMTVFEATAEEKFARRLTVHLLENYPTAVVRLPDTESAVNELPAETLHSLVIVSIERARSYGLTFESSISAFSAVMFEVAPNFDTHRLSQVMLHDENIEPDARLDELLEVLTEKNWETIRGDYDVNGWQSKAATEDSEDGEKSADEKNLDFAETSINVENAPKPQNPAPAMVRYFDETAMNFDMTKKPAKSEKDKDFDFPDTVLNIDSSKE